MKRNVVSWAALAVALAALVGAWSSHRPMTAAQDVPEEGQKIARALSDSFGAASEYVAPSVVQINVEKKAAAGLLRGGRGGAPGQGGPRGGLPGNGQMPKELEDMLKRFFGENGPPVQPQQFRRQQFVDSGTGSGFVFDEKGHILTNAHVVEGADKIVVTFHDGTESAAKVVGISPETDVAVIRVESSEYRPVKLGDSKNLRVGQWVLALGSPFGLDHTVTAGIISATERQEVGINRFEAFVQTDAAINPGNSGGPLVDLSGRVVAINSAIATASRSNSGVGFAIPINMAVRVANKLIRDGKVTPALMGITIEPVTPALARQLGLSPKTRGLLVTDVGEGTPAAKAGVQVNDVIVSYDGQPVSNRQSLQYLVTTSDIGQSYKLSYLRDGQPRETTVTPAAAETIAARMTRERDDQPEPEARPAVQKTELADFGFAVSPLTDELREKHGWEGDRQGVVVTGVVEDGPAQAQGMEVGDLITRVIKDRKITPVDATKDVQEAAGSTDTLSVYVEDVRKQAPGQFMTIDKAKAKKADGDAPAERGNRPRAAAPSDN
jgi:serine protease Do